MNNRILIVDDHPAVVMALHFLMFSEGFDVVAQTDDGEEALKLIEAFCPLTLILEIGISSIDWLAVMAQIAEKKLPVKVVVFTGLLSSHLEAQCRHIGVHGFVNKRQELSVLVNAVKAVWADQEYFPCWPEAVSCQYPVDLEPRQLKSLSARELGVMEQLVQGLSNKEIAETMLLSPKTIATYKARLFLKLNICSLKALYSFAERNGVGCSRGLSHSSFS